MTQDRSVTATFVPAVTVTATTPLASEGDGKGTFTFARTGNPSSALTVYYRVTGTATAGSDYASLGTSVTFAAGASTATKTVSPLQDNLHEGNESVILTLTPHPSYTGRNPSTARVVILNEDRFPRLR
jgi:hypothetical protein